MPTARGGSETHAGHYAGAAPEAVGDDDAELAALRGFRERLKRGGVVRDTVTRMRDHVAAGRVVLAEGANAALLDADFGTYPYVTSSSTTAGGVCTGLGLPPSALDCVVGVVKAYTTRVGARANEKRRGYDVAGSSRRSAPTAG